MGSRYAVTYQGTAMSEDASEAAAYVLVSAGTGGVGPGVLSAIPLHPPSLGCVPDQASKLWGSLMAVR